MMLAVESFYIPKDKPGKPNGEDAHFFNEAAQVIGVADGVGSWAKKGVDAGEYARELMANAEKAVYYCRPGQVDPKKVLIEASHRTKAPGSSTACIIALVGDNLVAANIGDSGFAVIRNGRIFYSSPVLQHGFNHPYQLGNSGGCDPPEKAEELTVKVEIGDVVVAGSDGVFANLYLHELEAIVDGYSDWRRLPEDIARAAQLRSRPYCTGPGPFAKKAKAERSRLAKETGLGDSRRDSKYVGFESKYNHIIDTGVKEDDITIVVACVVPYY